jgi:hypothetical protein
MSGAHVPGKSASSGGPARVMVRQNNRMHSRFGLGDFGGADGAAGGAFIP